METPINQMTLDEVKEQVAKQFTGGKHTWHSGYLNKSIKVILMDEVAKMYADSNTTQLKADKEELLEALENLTEYGSTGEDAVEMKREIESLIQKHKQ